MQDSTGNHNYTEDYPTFSTIFNFRKVTPELPVYRSAALDHASDQDYQTYLSSTGIRYRVDLRSPLEKFRSEHDKPLHTPVKGTFMAKRLSTPEVDISNDSLAKSTAKQLRFSDLLTTTRKKNVEKEPLVAKQTVIKSGHRVETFNINFLNARYRDGVIWDRCSRSEKLKMLSYMLTFRFNMLIKFVGEKILARGGLEGSYYDFIDFSSNSICSALQIITECLEKNDGAVAWSCFAGKDRTGLVTAFVKYIIGDEMEDILTDYAKSEEGLSPIMPRMVEEFAEQGLPDTFAKSPRIAMEQALAYVNKKYGSIDGYLDTIGFDKSWRDRLNAVRNNAA